MVGPLYRLVHRLRHFSEADAEPQGDGFQDLDCANSQGHHQVPGQELPTL